MITTVMTIFFGRLTCNCMSEFLFILSFTLCHLTFLLPRSSKKISSPRCSAGMSL